ncbi:MAG TPA: flagellar hook protein FlgE [Terracidiphilus sp.]
MSGFSIPLSGLAASSSALNVIANNLANLNTDGFKDQSLSFASIFNQMQGTSGSGDPIQVGSGVQIQGRTSDFSDGNVSSTGISSNMALQGDGFFVVEKNGQTSYTRAGNFTVNSDGYLTSASGQLVMGYPATAGVVNTSSALEPISVVSTGVIPGQTTTNFQMTANLNAGASVGDTFSTPMTVYDSLGDSHVLTVQFSKTGANAWSYDVTLPAADTGGTGAATSLASGALTFDSNGQLTSPTGSVTGVNITGLADGASSMSLNWSLQDSAGNSLLTQQFADSAASAPVQDGYGAGSLTGYSILADGTVQGTFSNNQTLALGQVAVARFANNQGLIQGSSNDYQASFASGAPIVGQAGVGGAGSITGGSVEASNVDLATEFSNMIVAQQGYQANAKVLTTMNQISQATLQIV